MKIKGIQSGKRGRRGEIIHLSHEEKAVEAVKDAIHKENTSDKMNLVYGVSLEAVDQLVQRETDKRTRKGATYDARGTVRYRPYNTASDDLSRPKSSKFKIRFEDCCDDLGQPDLRVVDFQLKATL